MTVGEISAKGIITKSNLPASDFVINPYVGCSHACIYCYARFMKRFSGHAESWGSFVDAKINAPTLIPERSAKYSGKSVFLSSVTDPYLPLEKSYRLTRDILQRLIPLKPALGILTKSALVVRDIDLLLQFERCDVGITITSLDETLRKKIEPGTSSVTQKIDALKELNKAGLRTYVFIGPILPFLTDWKAIIEATKEYADEYLFENLNMHGSIASDIHSFLNAHYPSLSARYREIYSPSSGYWQVEEQNIADYCQKAGIAHRIYFHHRSKAK